MPIKKKLFNAPFIISLGSGAGKILSSISSSDEYYKIAINSSEKDLKMIKSRVDEIITVGAGTGSGMSPTQGLDDIQNSIQKVYRQIDLICEEMSVEEIDLIPVIATVGHGFGSGSLPFILERFSHKYPTAILLPFVITPFSWEGKQVIDRAFNALSTASFWSTSIVISNEEVGEDISTGYSKVNTLLSNLIQYTIHALTAETGILQTVDKNDFSKFLQGQLATMRYMKLDSANKLSVDLIQKQLDKRWLKVDMKTFKFGKAPDKINIFYILDGRGPFDTKSLSEVSEYLSKKDFINQENIKPLLIERKTKDCNFIWLESGYKLKCDKNIYGVY